MTQLKLDLRSAQEQVLQHGIRALWGWAGAQHQIRVERFLQVLSLLLLPL